MIRQLALLVVVGSVLVVALMETTQNRPDDLRPGTASIVHLRVHASGPDHATATHRLAAACAGTLPEHTVTVLDHDRLHVQPAVGHHGWRRLRGCLEDWTLDRVVAQVLTATHHASQETHP